MKTLPSALQNLRLPVGFTGSSEPINHDQLANLSTVMEWLRPVILHHGDCINADAEADSVAHQLGIDVALHPPKNPVKRAFCGDAKVVYPALEYLERNRAIVQSTFVLIAVPRTEEDYLRSGTWSTVRFARKLRRPVLLLPPSGKISYLPGQVPQASLL